MGFRAPAQQQLYRLYGDPRTRGWESRWMTLWAVRTDYTWFPKERLYIHKDFRPLLSKAFGLLESRGLAHEVTSCEGVFSIRNVRGGSSLLSVHSWGCAIDLNAAGNPLGSSGSWSRAFIQAMQDSGLYCGQLWAGRKDPMHFSMVNG